VYHYLAWLAGWLAYRLTASLSFAPRKRRQKKQTTFEVPNRLRATPKCRVNAGKFKVRIRSNIEPLNRTAEAALQLRTIFQISSWQEGRDSFRLCSMAVLLFLLPPFPLSSFHLSFLPSHQFPIFGANPLLVSQD
jgi:hypothetical protein